MILSASRRTDIPAFYFDWFLNRIEDGFLYVRNPFKPDMVKKVDLSAELIDVIVFWTKDSSKIFSKLDSLNKRGYSYYFLYTITPYDKIVEPFVPSLENSINTFIRFSSIIGPERVIWRYDPIIVSKDFNLDFHFKKFENMCYLLKNYTNRVIVSFLKLYKKNMSRLKNLGPIELNFKDKLLILERFKDISSYYGIELQTCAEPPEFKYSGIKAGKCIDNDLITKITGREISYNKDGSQRKECLCNKSIDIGDYNSCKHFCLYCYANSSHKRVESRIKRHNSKSPFLINR